MSSNNTRGEIGIINTEVNISKIKSGDSNEVKLLIRSISASTFSMVYAMLKNKQDTEEVIQDACLKVIDSLLLEEDENGAFKYQSSLKTWIYTIVLNKAKDKIAYNKRDKRKAMMQSYSLESEVNVNLNLSSNAKPPDLILEHNESLLKLWELINMLPLKQREALILTKIDRNSMKQTAVIMKSTPKAIESLLSRARSNLKNIINQNTLKDE